MTTKPTAVLIVDDSPTAREFLCDAIEEAGYACHATGDPTTVCALLREHDIRVLCLDMGMPGRSGLEVLGDVKAYEAATGVKVYTIIITGSHDKKDAMHALMKGAFLYLNKPVQERLLLEGLQKVHDEMTAAGDPSPAEAPRRHDELTAIDEAVAHVRRPEGMLNAQGYARPILLTTTSPTLMATLSDLLATLGYGVVCMPNQGRLEQALLETAAEVLVVHAPLSQEAFVGLCTALRTTGTSSGPPRQVIMLCDIGQEQTGILMHTQLGVMDIPLNAAVERLPKAVAKAIERFRHDQQPT